jgi:hypothetical protein
MLSPLLFVTAGHLDLGRSSPTLASCRLSLPQRNASYSRRPMLWARARESTRSSNDDEDFRKSPKSGIETPVSRRLFLLGVSVTGGVVLNQGVQLWDDYYGDSLRDRLSQPFRRAFPSLFEPSSSLQIPSTRRASLNPAFASFFFDAHAAVACDQLRLLSHSDLARDEADVRDRSRALFFPKGQAEPDAGSDLMYNYNLYCRVHSIGAYTSPQTRIEFSRALGGRCLAYIERNVLAPNGTKLPTPSRYRGESGKDHAEDWLIAIRVVLQALVDLGWISEFKVSDFDYMQGSTWREEGRGELTVDSTAPVTLQSAMLIGEEEMEEISPKISGILYNVLVKYGLSSISLEDYYMDIVYRKDYSPQQLVTQFNFSLPKLEQSSL